MVQTRYTEFLKRIAKESGLNENDVDDRVKQKQSILGGLVSLEGAALIVASDLGIKFDAKKVLINELMVGMRNLDVVGKIVGVYPTRTYRQKDGVEGKIGSFLFADETGSIRVVLWDTNHIQLITDEKIKEGDVLLLKKVDVRGIDIKELHLGGKSSIAHSQDQIEKVKLTFSLSSSKISEVKDGDRTSIRATVVQTFPFRFFPSCPECRKRLAESSGKYECVKHGEMNPKFLPVFSFYIDDGSSNIRAVCFLEAVEKLFSIGVEEIIALKDNPKEQDLREGLLGDEFLFEGRVRKNTLFNRLEFVVNSVSPIDVDSLIDELSNKIDAK